MKVKRSKLLSDSLFVYVTNLLLRLKGLIFLPVIINAVGVKSYGVFVQLLINPRLIAPFANLGLGLAFSRYSSQHDEENKKALSKEFWTVILTGFTLSLIGAVVLYLISPVLSRQLLDNLALDSLRLSSLLVITHVLHSLLNSFLQARKKFKIYSIHNVLYQLLPYFGFVAFIVWKQSIYQGLICYLAMKGFFVVVLFIYIVIDVGFALPSFRILKRFLSYSWPLTLTTIEGGLLSKVDRYFIGFFLGPAAIGIYNVIYSVVSLIDSFTIPFRKFFANYLPKVWDEGQTERVKNYLKEGLVYFLVVAAGALVGMAIYLRPLLLLLLKKSLQSIPNLELLIVILGLGIIAYGSSRFFFQVIKFSEKNLFRVVLQLIAVAANMAICYFLIPATGILGAGIATFTGYVLISVLCNIRFRLNVTVDFFLTLLKILVACVPMLLPVFIWRIDSVSLLLLSMFLSTAIYLTLIVLLRVVTLKTIRQRLTGARE